MTVSTSSMYGSMERNKELENLREILACQFQVKCASEGSMDGERCVTAIKFEPVLVTKKR
jgi:hypothetical protein